MEILDLQGYFVIDGREVEAGSLRVIVSTGGDGLRLGSGTFALPLALVGAAPGTAFGFRSEAGEEIALTLREIDPAEGVGYFLTEDPIPERAAAARRA
jgi:hypothetical protein